MNFFTNLSSKIQPLFYLRESQMARLFVTAFDQLEGMKECAVFKNMLLQMAIDDHDFFIRLAKTDVELLIWLINGGTDVFDTDKEYPPIINDDNFNLLPSVSIAVLRSTIDPIIINKLAELSRENKGKLKKIFTESPSFIKLFKKNHKEFIDSIESFPQKY